TYRHRVADALSRVAAGRARHRLSPSIPPGGRGGSEHTLVVALDRRRAAAMLTVAEAAVLAGVRPTTVRAWCASGRLVAVRVLRTEKGRGECRIRRADLDPLLGGHPRTRSARKVDGDVTRSQALRRIASEIS